MRRLNIMSGKNMGCSKWSYENMVKETDRLLHHRKLGEDTLLKEAEDRIINHKHDNLFYFICGEAYGVVLDDICRVGSTDEINAAVAGSTMFKQLIGLE